MKEWEGTNLSRKEWKDFTNSSIWKAFLYELEDRENYLLQLYKDNDPLWNSDTIRGKLTEIDYFKQLPNLIILSIIAEDNNKEKEKEDADR